MSYLYPAVTPCHDAFVLPYAAYLRVYEPLSAFCGAEAGTGRRMPRLGRPAAPGGALEAEHAEALRRLIAVPPTSCPAWESGDAYVRWADGITYICPWQTRLRSWLGLARLRSTARRCWSAAFAADEAETAAAASPAGRARRARCGSTSRPGPGRSPRPGSCRSRPRSAGSCSARAAIRGRRPGDGHGDPHAHLRHRRWRRPAGGCARALAAFRRAGTPSPRAGRRWPAGRGAAAWWPSWSEIGCWLEEFHPHSLVELDYGGLVHLLDDEALRADQSVAEVSAAVSALPAASPSWRSRCTSGSEELAGAGALEARQLSRQGTTFGFRRCRRYVSLEYAA